MANGFPCWFAQTPAASSSVVKEMLERQGLETVSQHRQGQMIEDAIRKAFAEFGECSEVRSASEFGGPLDFPQKCGVGIFDQFESQICRAALGFYDALMPREMRFESSRTTQTAVDLLERR